MDFFKNISAFIGRLTGSLAGIAAIFYACGYLVARSHFNMLGLFGLFDFPKERYLQEGGKFFTALAGMVIAELLPWFVLGLYLLTGLFLLGVTLVGLCFALKRRQIPERCLHIFTLFKGFFETKRRLTSSCVVFFLGYVLIFRLLDYYNDFSSVLGISNLIYKSSATLANDTIVGHLEKWLLDGNLEPLRDYFLHLLKGESLALVLLALAWYATAVLPTLRPWLILPFLLIAVLYTLFTLMAYGVLVRPTKYPVVIMSWKGQVGASQVSGFSLLNKTNDELVLWDGVAKKVYCVPTGGVQSVEVIGMKSLFFNTDNHPKED